MLIRISNPSTESYFWENQLTAPARRGDNVLAVLENRKAPDAYLIVGEVGNKGTEIVKPVGITTNLITLTSTLKENHTQAVNLYFTYYKNFELERFVDGEPFLLGTFPIQWSKSESVVNDEEYEKLIGLGHTVEYKYSYINASNNRKTKQKDAWIGDDLGYTFNDQMVTVWELIRELNRKAHGNEDSNETPPSEWLLYLNYTISELNNEIISQADDEYFVTQADLYVLAGKANYLLPTDFVGILDVRIDGCTIESRPFVRREQTCNQCVVEEECEEKVDPCNLCEVEVKDDCEVTPCVFEPIYFYNITQSEILIDPVPVTDKLLTLTYQGLPAPLSLESRGTYLPNGYRETLVTGALFRKFFYNRTPEGQSYASNVLQLYGRQKEVLLERMFTRKRGRKPNRSRVVRGVRAQQIYDNPLDRFSTPSRFNNFRL